MPQSPQEEHRFVTQESLVRKWRDDHKILMHMEQKEKLKLSDIGKATGEIAKLNHPPEFKEKRCFKLGVCVCVSKGSVAVSFCSKLAKHFRKYFGTKKAKSPQILAWQKGMYVVSLSNSNGDDLSDNVDEFFFHVGHTDFRTWEMCALRLFKRHHNPIDQSIVLQAGGVGDTEGLDIRMLLEFMKSDDIGNIDLSQHCYVQLYRIVNDRSLAPADFMMPCYLTIKRESNAVCIWDGHGHKRKRRRQQPNRCRRQRGNAAAAGDRNGDNFDNADAAIDDDNDDDGSLGNGDDGSDAEMDLLDNIDSDGTNESEFDIDQLCSDLLSCDVASDNEKDDGLQDVFGDDEQAAQDAVFAEIDFHELGIQVSDSDSDTDLPARDDDVGILITD